MNEREGERRKAKEGKGKKRKANEIEGEERSEDCHERERIW